MRLNPASTSADGGRSAAVHTPITIGSRALLNRVAFASVTTGLNGPTALSDAQREFLVRRARGGAALIVTDGLAVHPSSRPFRAVPRIEDDAHVDGYERLCVDIHAAGSVVVGQLWHVGASSLYTPEGIAWAPSATPDPLSGTVPHAMTVAEVEEVIDGYVDAARRLQSVGFDGVEVHAAHGYLPAQFLSSMSNHRTDAYGGDLRGRAAFLTAVLQGIRATCGPDFILGIKLTAHEYAPGGIELPEAQEVAAHVCEVADPDYIAVSQSRYGPSLERHSPDMSWADTPFEHLTRGIRNVVPPEVAIMALAKIPDLAVGDRLIDEGTADLIGLARPLLADADLVRRDAVGATVRPCTFCNACWAALHEQRGVECFYDPRTGHELEIADLEPEVRSAPDLVVVLGGGPAGLEAARVAATLGHRVELHEEAGYLGGRLALEARIPGRADQRRAVDWWQNELADLGVDIRLGSEPDPAALSAAALVVDARSRLPAPPVISGVDAVPVEDVLAGGLSLDEDVYLLDAVDDEPVYALAEWLAQRGHRVVLVTPRPAPARRVAMVSAFGISRRLDLAGVVVATQTAVTGTANGQLVGVRALSGRAVELGPEGTVVSAGSYRGRDPLEVPGVRIVQVGDAYVPRTLAENVREAHRVVRQALEQAGEREKK
ncbi:hypothetical protein DLJ46_02180 [Micromonospora globispora]|uniref:NADH:flavin oxidoreductase/NADH oxidase N-terminal domain-containing protein n=1 Tax=Micromonospora globispora TaxID=1450148 RepID=A0A317KGX4_9ACTN|nr:FAD-dependent oxidoreductase [Micromonospora globispora]PWU52853.1 hypothetical protein DLJ46_02180 [Micromonospora globispora]RQW86560.1 hypothetical protein DKL51_27375 [Micromonospora globispora]